MKKLNYCFNDKKRFNNNDSLKKEQKDHFITFFDEIQRKLLTYKKMKQ